MSDFESDNFLSKLKEVHEWPCTYMFKFIVPKEQVTVLENTIKLEHTKMNPSKNGKYISMTFEVKANTAEDVVAIYRLASKVKGIIAL